MLIGYARVSTDAQDLDAQTHALQAAGVHPGAIHAEHVSGTSAARPVLDRAIATLGAGDVLVVARLDRLTRRGVLSMHEVLRAVAGRGARVWSLGEPWCHPSSPVNDLLVSVFGWLAEQEVQQIRARTNDGLTAARARGVRFGRPPKVSQMQLEMARDLLAAGRTKQEVCSMLGVHRATLARALSKLP